MKTKFKLIIVFNFGLIFCNLVACKSLSNINYDCPINSQNKNICIVDTITINHPILITIYEGKKCNQLLIPYSSLKSIHKHSTFYGILKKGGMLIAFNVESYLPQIHSSVKDSDLTVRTIMTLGKNEVREFKYPITKFVVLRVNQGCYNKFERFIGWIPIKSSDMYLNVLFPLI